MNIQKIDQHTTFGAKNVIINENIVNLGLKTVKAFREVLPDLYKMGDKSTVIWVSQNTGHTANASLVVKSNMDELLIQAGKDLTPEPKTFLSRLFRKIIPLKWQKSQIEWNDAVKWNKSSETSRLKEIAQSAVTTMEENIEAKQVMEEIRKDNEHIRKRRG